MPEIVPPREISPFELICRGVMIVGLGLMAVINFFALAPDLPEITCLTPSPVETATTGGPMILWVISFVFPLVLASFFLPRESGRPR